MLLRKAVVALFHRFKGSKNLAFSFYQRNLKN